MNVAEWLRSLGLEHYRAAFEQNNVDANLLPRLTSEDLRDLGIASVGHRRRLLDAITRLREGGDAAGALGSDASPGSDVRSNLQQSLGERRQLTVLFCDVADFTRLSTRLDPEDLSSLIREYQSCVAAVIRQFEGFIARYVGDGVLVYFGWPEARETDAERAVRSALEIIPAIGRSARLNSYIRARIGIATGLVVVGEPIGTGEAWQQTAIGETPNVAARLQAVAEPDTVVISESTRQLIGDLFDYSDLGWVALKGIADPVRVWRVLRPSEVESRFEALRGSSLTPLVGRDEEIALLLKRWQDARRNEGKAVLLSGEPGIGKSRLVSVLDQRIKDEPHIRLRYFCSPHHGDSALYPFVAQMGRAAGFARGDSRETRLQKLRVLLAPAFPPDEDVALVAELLLIAEVSDLYPSLHLTPQQKRERTFEALLQQLDALARTQPILMIFEDVHWMDPSSRGLLDRTIERVRHLPVLVVLTFRPEFIAPWTGQPHVTTIALTRLDARNAAALIRGLATGESALPDDLVGDIVERTDGIPLFAEELTKAVLESSANAAGGIVSAASQTSLSVPSTLHASLMARLDRLGPQVTAVAQIGAAIGREFSYELISAVARQSDGQLRQALDRLVDAGLILQRDVPPAAVFRFRHALIQDAAYGTLLRGPRQEVHSRIASALVKLSSIEPELLAHHFAEAGQLGVASEYWLEAGRRASRRSANIEAIAHTRKGIEAIVNIPDVRWRAERELALHLVLGPALIATKGWGSAEVGQTYRRALDLAQQLNVGHEWFNAAWGLWFFRATNGEPDVALGLVDDLFKAANRLNDTALQLQAHHAAWPTDLFLGRLTSAGMHVTQGLELYDEAKHREHAFLYGGHDVTVCGKGQGSLVLWLLGYPDQAEQSARDAVALGEKLAHVPTLVHGLMWAALAHQMCRDLPAVLACSERLCGLSTEHRLPQYSAVGSMLRCWASARQGKASECAADLLRVLNEYTSLSKLLYAFFHSDLAEVYHLGGDSRLALTAIDEALRLSDHNSERFWRAEMLRLKGDILRGLSPDSSGEADAWYRKALDLSCEQSAKSLELRTVVSIGRMLQRRGDSGKAYALIAPVYDWFTEGFGTPDLAEAKSLLDELRS